MLTAAENYVDLWDIKDGVFQSIGKRTYEHYQSTGYSTENNDGSAGSNSVFGGPRNPDMIAYVFDVKIAPPNSTRSNDVAAVALSDGMYACTSIQSYTHNIFCS